MENTKITLRPSEQIIQAANTVEYVEAGGMRIGLKKPDILAQYDAVEILGDSAQNATYMQMIMPILWVAEIDGEAESMPTTKRELRARIQRLGEAGVAAIMAHLTQKAEALTGNESVKK